MRLIRYIGVNLRRTLGRNVFWYCVLAACALCFTAVVTKDPKSNEGLMVLQVLFRRELIEQQTDLNAWNVFCSAYGTWFVMFAPILSAFPFVPTIINNRITQSARFTISRIGKRRYLLGNICTTFLSGGMAVVLGYVLFGIAVWLLFPSVGDYSEQMAASVLESLTWGKPAWYANALFKQQYYLPILLQLGQMFLYGGCGSLLALVFAAFVKNPYIVLCMPFFLTYGWMQINTRLTMMAYADVEHMNPYLTRLTSLTNPCALAMLLGYDTDLPRVLCIHLGFALLLCAAYYLISNRRVDCGE